jgi:hypothetical protein
LGIYNEFPQNHSWRFVNESDIVDPFSPWPVPDTRIIQDLDNNMMQEDFIGIKVGDVNNSATANLIGQSVDSRSAKSLPLYFEDFAFEKGERFEMIVNADQINDLSGMQFTLNTVGLDLISVEGIELDLTEENIARLNENQTTFSWHTSLAKDVSSLFRITFIARTNGILSESVAIGSERVRSEAYLGDNFETVPVKLAGRNNSEQTFTLYQNNPNPFNGSTTISFDLPEKTTATLTVIDVTGRILWSFSDEFNKGTQSIIISERDINASGVLYYQLEAGTFSAVKKMIIIE